MAPKKKQWILGSIEEEQFKNNRPHLAIGIPPCKDGLLMKATILTDMNKEIPYSRKAKRDREAP